MRSSAVKSSYARKCDNSLISIMGMNIIDLIVVFCACRYVTHKAERKWSAATYQCLEILSRKRSENLVACYSYWPMSSSSRDNTSNRVLNYKEKF